MFFRAMDDIKESIEELRYYRKTIFIEKLDETNGSGDDSPRSSPRDAAKTSTENKRKLSENETTEASEESPTQTVTGYIKGLFKK